MTEIDLPASVIKAGVFVYKDVLGRNRGFTSEEFVEEIFTAMATALVKHDRELAKDDPHSRDLVGADGTIHGYGIPNTWLADCLLDAVETIGLAEREAKGKKIARDLGVFKEGEIERYRYVL